MNKHKNGALKSNKMKGFRKMSPHFSFSLLLALYPSSPPTILICLLPLLLRLEAPSFGVGVVSCPLYVLSSST